MPDSISIFSFWFASFISVGSLLFYLSGAIWNRMTRKEIVDARYDFNLGIPQTNDRENLFAIALVAAGTSLSTVFVFFLTAGAVFGWWIVLGPFLFALGNWITFVVYNRTVAHGYFEERQVEATGAAGLVPYLGERLTGSKMIGWVLVLLSLVNLFAVLVLELVVGVEVFGYLSAHTLRADPSSSTEFLIFAISVLLLLGYVFIGGFRAVIASDVWQMKIMKAAIFLAIISILIYGASSSKSSLDWTAVNKKPPLIILWGFVVNVILANLFVPFSQESSWQRFRAFVNSKEFNLKRAISLSVLNSIGLWVGLIILAFSLLILLPDKAASFSRITDVLEVLRTLNDWWFPLFIFPIMTVAALSAMYSTADTSVSALLYLIEYSRFTKRDNRLQSPDKGLPKSYYIGMGIILVASIGAYAFVRVWFNPTILQLIFSVFSNLVVIAPTIISTTILPPYGDRNSSQKRVPYVFASLLIGFIFYWGSALAAIVLGQDYLWLSQLAIASGLLGATIPLLPLWISNKREFAIGR
jgi:Na+/proline symporter